MMKTADMIVKRQKARPPLISMNPMAQSQSNNRRHCVVIISQRKRSIHKHMQRRDFWNRKRIILKYQMNSSREMTAKSQPKTVAIEIRIKKIQIRSCFLLFLSSEQEEEEEEEHGTYGRKGVVGEPDGREVTPSELPLGDVAATGEGVTDPNRVVAALPVGVDALVFPRPRRRRARHSSPSLPPLSLCFDPFPASPTFC